MSSAETHLPCQGNDASGDPAILVGDDGLAVGPMVAVALLGC